VAEQNSGKAEGLLVAAAVTIRFGGLTALNDFHLSINRGDLQGLIGPNGAGKTTAFNVLTGVYKPTSGDIRVCGEHVNGRLPHQINRAGLARTFQNIRLFKQLSVLDNVRIACLADSHPLFSRRRCDGLRRGGASVVARMLEATNNYVDWWRALFRTPGFVREEHEITERAIALLDVMGTSWGSRTASIGRQRISRTASSAASRSRAPSARARRCCSSTSPRRA
jgi:branched-chain amino acid transport system ATP-binding protein